MTALPAFTQPHHQQGRMRVLGILVLALAALAGVLAVNTWRQGSVQMQVAPIAHIDVKAEAVAESLSQAIRARTLSSATDANASADQFEALRRHIESRYPRVHARLQREVFNGHSLLYTWPGTQAAQPGIALMAHQDVVPVAPGTEGDWQAPPFEGRVQDGYVWGRGAWDDKSNLITQLEAVERLLAEGFQPRRTVYLVFGADEEVGGIRGAKAIAQALKQRGVKLDFVVDEGLLITQGIMPGLKAPAAMVGVAEKGYLSLKLQANATPGHSSMPPAPGESAIARLSAVLTDLDRHPWPARIDGVSADLFDTVAPELSGFSRVALSNRWLFEPVLLQQMTKSPSTRALLSTTTALTVVQAGNKDNVLPGRAEATVNFRLLPGDTIAEVQAEVKRRAGPEHFEVSALPGGGEASRVSSHHSEGFRHVERTVRELFPDTIVAPGLMLGATDGRHFEGVADQVLRFSPVRAGPDDLSRFHGTNERIAVDNLAEMVRFYHRLLTQAAGPTTAAKAP